MKKLLNLNGARHLGKKDQQTVNGGGSGENCSQSVTAYYHCVFVLQGFCTSSGQCLISD